jgi:hypothetical protein
VTGATCGHAQSVGRCAGSLKAKRGGLGGTSRDLPEEQAPPNHGWQRRQGTDAVPRSAESCSCVRPDTGCGSRVTQAFPLCSHTRGAAKDCHGKEGVAGSSPAEGLDKPAGNGGFFVPARRSQWSHLRRPRPLSFHQSDADATSREAHNIDGLAPPHRKEGRTGRVVNAAHVVSRRAPYARRRDCGSVRACVGSSSACPSEKLPSGASVATT